MESESSPHYPVLKGRQIRLLRVFVHATIPLQKFSFEIVDLDHAPRYEAISYVWGPIVGRLPLELSTSQVIKITATLKFAIPHLRGAARTGLLWIDQICINQEDLTEKASQVVMMADIFRNAERVIAWLGPADMQTPILTELVKKMGSEPEGPHICQRADDQGPLDAVKAKLLSSFNYKGRKGGVAELRHGAVAALLGRPWFRRSWIFQEFVLAKSIIMLLGDTQFAPRDIDRLVTALHGLQSFLRADAPVIATKGHQPFIAMVHARDRLYRKQPGREFMRFLVEKAGVFEYSDARDVVYGFLSFVSSSKISIVPNYGLSIFEVFITTTRATIEASRCLDIIGLASLLKEKSKIESLPSWVPDLTRRRAFYGDIWERNDDNGFDAAKGRHHKSVDSENAAFLVVKGKIIDQVERVHHVEESCTFPVKEAQSTTMFKDWVLLDGRLETINRCHVAAMPGAELYSRQRLFKTLIAEGACCPIEVLKASPTSINPSMTATRLSRLFEIQDKYAQHGVPRSRFTKKPVDKQAEIDLWILKLHGEILKGRSVIVTAKKKLGLSVIPTMPGDTIFILHGSGAPVVLRPQPQEDGSSTCHWAVVGQCYLEDAMRGEMVDWEEEEADTFIIV